MHYIHAILVDVKEEIKYHNEPMEAIDAIKDHAREIAMSETETYGEGHVFDWRTDEDAGRWNEMYPGKGVILGLENVDRFLELFEQYSTMPFENAKETFLRSQHAQTGWRSELEISDSKELEVIPNPRNGDIGREGLPIYWSGVKNPPIVIDEAFISKLWSGEIDDYYAYLIKKILKLTSGEYQSDSNFYSIPDYSAKASAETIDDVRKNPKNYALVFSDYHN